MNRAKAISFPSRGSFLDPKTGRRYAVFCAVRFCLTAAGLGAVAGALVAADAPLGEGRSILTAIAVQFAASSLAALSAVAWLRAFARQGSGARTARASATVAFWIWLAGIPAVLIVGSTGADPRLGLLALALLNTLFARPPLLLRRVAPVPGPRRG
jgi:hypothetical protein